MTLVVAAVVVVVGVAAVALGGSSSKSPSAPPTTVQAAPTTVAETSPASSAAPATVAGALSKADYIAAADGICARYKPQLDTATNSGNIAAAIPLLESELAEIEGLGSPATDAQIVRAAFEDITQAVPYLQAGDLTNANARILAGDTLAGQFGLQVCNYGH